MKRVNRAMSRNAWGISTALFPFLQVFWRKNIASTEENTSWKPLKMPYPRVPISKCPEMPRPSRTCAFCPSSKGAYYSLLACYLNTFWQPWVVIHIVLATQRKWFCFKKDNTSVVISLLTLHLMKHKLWYKAKKKWVNYEAILVAILSLVCTLCLMKHTIEEKVQIKVDTISS